MKQNLAVNLVQNQNLARNQTQNLEVMIRVKAKALPSLQLRVERTLALTRATLVMMRVKVRQKVVTPVRKPQKKRLQREIAPRNSKQP